MIRTRLWLVVVGGLLLNVVSTSLVRGSDLVSVPTANQLKAEEVYAGICYTSLQSDNVIPGPQPIEIDFVQTQYMSVGVTDDVELQLTHCAVDLPSYMATPQTSWDALVRLQDESRKRPGLVIGVHDFSRIYGPASYFLASAKTLNPTQGPPQGPIVRAYLAVGTEDHRMSGEGRHEGLFGGVQVILPQTSPSLELLALYDGVDTILGISVKPAKGWLRVRIGTFGGDYYFDVGYLFNCKGRW